MIGANLDGGTNYFKLHTTKGLDTFKRTLSSLHNDIGFTALRFWVYGHHNDGSGVIKGPGDYEFGPVVAALKAIRDEGLYTYCNWGWLPRSFSGGQPTYEMFAGWISDPKTSDADLIWLADDGTRWRFRTIEEAPYLFDPIPHVDGPVEGFGEAFASECSDLIDWIGTWNEPGKRPSPFWAAQDLARLYDEVLRPFATGYRRGSSGGVATFVGPEAHVDSVLDELCRIEQERGYGVFDVLSWHVYSWSPDYLTAALRRSDEFVTAHRKWAHGRPGMNTESENHERTAELFAACADRYGDDLRAQFVFEPDLLYVGGAKGWERGEFTLNERGRKMKAMIAGEVARTKRRSVR